MPAKNSKKTTSVLDPKHLPLNPLLVIVGPTSSGKSDLAVKLAKKFNGEVISADSRQVYKGLNIATGKITKKEMKGIPHHLLSIVDSKKQYTASDYINDGRIAIGKILKKGKFPIICGGTGFYISALLGEMSISSVLPNKSLRVKLAKETALELYIILKKLDPKRAGTVDAKNLVRLIRAIEIASAPPRKGGELRDMSYELREKFKIIKIGLKLPADELRKRIHARVMSRTKKGMVAEAKRLYKQGLSYRRMRELGLEYRALADYLQIKITKQELVERIEKENWQYAKRQMTWFKRDKEIIWFQPDARKLILACVEKFNKSR